MGDLTLDADVARDLGDIAPPCESSYWHPKVGDGPAVWIVWQVVCCDERPDFGLGCDACLQAALAVPWTRCADCGYVNRPGRLAIRRIEPINRRTR